MRFIGSAVVGLYMEDFATMGIVNAFVTIKELYRPCIFVSMVSLSLLSINPCLSRRDLDGHCMTFGNMGSVPGEQG